MNNTFQCPGTPCRKWIGTSLKSQSSCLLVFSRARRKNKAGCELKGCWFHYNIPLLLIDNSCVASCETLTSGMKWLQLNWMYRILKRGRYGSERKITSLHLQGKSASCSSEYSVGTCSHVNVSTGILTFISQHYIMQIDSLRDESFVEATAEYSNRL